MPGPRPKLPFATVKPRACKAPGCRNKFIPERPSQIACGPECALAVVRAKAEKEARIAAKAGRAADKERKEALMTITERMDRAQKVINKWVRLVRDRDEPCISCGQHKDCYDAGHYRSVGAARAALRFVEDNIHKQCCQCNQHKGSNAIEYRIRLVEKIGVERVEALERTPAPFKPTVEWVEEIRSHYQRLLGEAGVKL